MRISSLLVSLVVLLLAASLAWAAELSLSYSEGGEDSLCSDAPCLVKAKSITASSVLEKKSTYAAPNAADGKADSAWCEGSTGAGEGEWIRFDFGKPVNLAGFFITPFYAKNKETLFSNSRVKRLKIEWEGGASHEVAFRDEDPKEAFAGQMDYSAPYVNFVENASVKKPVTTSWVKFTIIAVYPGAKFKDACISEISFSNKAQ